ncbi:MAG TPA: YqgE/AlgH family protein [Mediterranea massiliensis]|jgi:putative transcriptional regulator|uniref:YqgE/AlgH family protein n=1 Tax=Mediterranea massiliensis TaxID=1841865 RepID=A0A921HVN3_9BACT|nr:YqgE/AlgH family protein [Mediterranea massiliensis]MBM6736191.1 YqgE/AlgH family protein [Mediterranea massiliensis]CCZ46976.1 uncharacterized ACR [Bacteroides sp. CAG:661]HJF91265.1 YqgE/AlgH family protein [Mediterranea massiliensis]
MPESIDIFKIESNHVLPTRGKILISEPFLCDKLFSRSVILMIDHTCEGSMGLVMNKLSSLSLAEIFEDLDGKENIPIYWGGPLGTDTIFYIHTLTDIPHSLPLGKGLYMNGDFESVKEYIRQGKEIEGKIRFFVGYSGWEKGQLHEEIQMNTWIVSQTSNASLMDEKESSDLWRTSLDRLGGKYKIWSRFPQRPGLN